MRNSICFSDKYDINIISEQIKEKINFLEKLNFVFNKFCEIKVTFDTWYLKYLSDNKIDSGAMQILIDDKTLCYLEINYKILKFEYMIDIIKHNNEHNSEQYLVKYNPKSFRQSDDSIKYKLYELLEQNINDDNICFMGGEMVFFAKLLNPQNSIFYTDFESIYNDANINFPKNNIHLIDYDKDKLNLDLIFKYDINTLITNTSKSGLGVNMCNEILNIKFKNVIIISCNRKSFMKDFNILCKKYSIKKIYDIKTNYTVSIYFLAIK
jgi:hypothetical protein